MKVNTLFLGNSIDIMKRHFKNSSISLVYADPPYNLSGNKLKWKDNKTGGNWYMIDEAWDKMSKDDYWKFTYEWISQSSRILKKNGSLFVSCTFHNIAEVMLSMKLLDMKINNIITWYKTNAMPNMTKRVYTHSTEYIVWAVNGSNWIFNYENLKEINPERQKNGKLKQMRDLWKMPLVQGRERIKSESGRAAHPTQKPVEMLKRIILASSLPGDIVFDPFAGSGTTLVVAERFKRKWIGVERETKYIKIIQQRLKKEFKINVKVTS
ncbi:site-specific DNA-methyltransferase [Candidatus Dependentiae bacterium]|nr:site-specific DNA-methyltransferase [Candidatus Dependentiae bacterium]